MLLYATSTTWLEEEAHRIAHLLHDEAGQSLFATQVSLLELEAKVDPSLRPNLKRVLDVLHQVGEQLRSLSHELRPTILVIWGWFRHYSFWHREFRKEAR